MTKSWCAPKFFYKTPNSNFGQFQNGKFPEIYLKTECQIGLNLFLENSKKRWPNVSSLNFSSPNLSSKPFVTEPSVTKPFVTEPFVTIHHKKENAHLDGQI